MIAYYSRGLIKHQENYSASEKEALNIVDMLKTHSCTLLGNKTRANTYALNLLGENTLSSRLTRWLLLIQEHDVYSNHIDGTSNLFSDALSRMPRLDDVEAYDCNNEIACTKFCFAV